MRWQDPHRPLYASSRGLRQGPEAHRFALSESPAQSLPQALPAMPGLKCRAKATLFVGMNAGLSIPSMLSSFSQRYNPGKRS
jgi:hypothetical protein